MADKVIGLLEKVKNIYRKRSLQFILSLSFTLVAVAVMIGVAAGFSPVSYTHLTLPTT